MKLAFAARAARTRVPARAESQVSNYLYLNRCKGGCTVHGGFDDARAMSSSIPCAGAVTCGDGGCSCNGGTGGDYVIEEFKNSHGPDRRRGRRRVERDRAMRARGLLAVQHHGQRQPPPGGLSHTQGIVAGRPANIDYGSAGIGGIAPGSLACAPQDNVISFSFANIYGGPNRIIDICATAAQETAHSFGLDHAFEFTDGRSACTDPMSYRSDCGGAAVLPQRQRDVRRVRGARRADAAAFRTRTFALLAIFGEGTPLTAPPRSSSTARRRARRSKRRRRVRDRVGATRRRSALELWLNGYKWATVKGAPFGSDGQPETQYSLMFPATVPDGVIDVVVKAFDDIDAETDTPDDHGHEGRAVRVGRHVRERPEVRAGSLLLGCADGRAR